MSPLAAIRKLWRSIAPRTRSDVEEEFRSTLDAYQEDLVRQGLPEEEARRKARIELGRPAAQNETYRDAHIAAAISRETRRRAHKITEGTIAA